MSPNHSRSPAASTGRGGVSDEAILHRLGYAQVLYREMGGFSNFAISFTIISILSGCLNSYYIGFWYGGPSSSPGAGSWWASSVCSSRWG